MSNVSYYKKAAIKFPKTFAKNQDDLFTYQVPELTADGTCNLGTALAAEAYDLRVILNVRNKKSEAKVAAQLETLHDLLDLLQSRLQADWVGIYQAATSKDGKPVLVKLAYRGKPSRAEFPLTKDFAELSNNTTVGLYGKAVIINDVSAHSGPYYTCDGLVQSEICLPIFDSKEQKILGIIDAESFTKNHFTKERIALAAKLSQLASEFLPIKA